MERDKIQTEVVNAISHIMGIHQDDIKETDSLKNDIGVESIDAIELLMDLEREFSIEIPDEEAQKLENGKVSDIIDYLVTNTK